MKTAGNVLFWVFIGFVGILAWGYFTVPSQSLIDGKAIDLCWEEYERKSLTPDQKRFIAGACEMMEDEFRNKHGYKY